jgi:phosphoribosylformimino-5-aminoimidazole carboxamide ribotide isomerase
MTHGDTFILYPAIDILKGNCVRLTRGDYAQSTAYHSDPVKVAENWIEHGAKWLHVVDLDGAKVGSAVNQTVISDIVKTASAHQVKVQVGGGIRSHDAVAHWLERGASRCIIGTAALDMIWVEKAVRDFGADALVIGLDGRAGKMAVNGWTEQTDRALIDMAGELFAAGVRHALVTDVDRDGTLSGANVSLAAEVQSTGIASIVSGGIATIDDVLAAKAAGLSGAIAGRAIYDGRINLRQAFTALGV